MGTSSAIKGGAKSTAETVADSTIDAVTKTMAKQGMDIADDEKSLIGW